MITTSVFIHGLGQTADSWKGVLPYLNSNENLIRPELGNFISKIDHSNTYDSLYSLLANKLNGLDGALSLCGLSLGGILALNYAIEFPEKVGSLILLATQYKMPSKLLTIQNVIFKMMPNSTFNKIGLPKSDLIKLTQSMRDLDFTESIHKIDCPSLIIYGSKDKANKKASEKLASLIPKSQLKILDGVGHELNIEAPEELADVINNFNGEKRK